MGHHPPIGGGEAAQVATQTAGGISAFSWLLIIGGVVFGLYVLYTLFLKKK